MSKRLSRKEIREDRFLTTTVEAWEYLREHQNTVFVVLIVIVALVAGGFWLNGSRSRSHESAVSQFAEGVSSYRGGDVRTAEEIFKLVVERYGRLREGAHAEYFLGVCALQGGRNAQAIEAFDRYLRQSGKYPFYRDAAKDGKAVALENERRYAEAAEIYLEIATHPETNDFMAALYLERAAETFKLAANVDRAIGILEMLLEKTDGLERRDIETELEILRG